MNDFQNPISQVQRLPMSPADQVDSGVVSPRQAAPEADSKIDGRDWKDLLLDAKTLHKCGREIECRRLYRLGLQLAESKLGNKQDELVEFLRNEIWR